MLLEMAVNGNERKERKELCQGSGRGQCVIGFSEDTHIAIVISSTNMHHHTYPLRTPFSFRCD